MRLRSTSYCRVKRLIKTRESIHARVDRLKPHLDGATPLNLQAPTILLIQRNDLIGFRPSQFKMGIYDWLRDAE